MSYGPVDFIALEFKTEQLKGEIMPELLDLVQKQIVRVIDLVMIQKYADGSHEAVEVQQLAPELLGVFDPLHAEISGIIQVEDIDMIAQAMDNNTLAAALLFENVWAVKFKDAVIRAKGNLLAQGRIPNEEIENVLAIFASTDAKKLSSPAA
ncbi:MAG TPA: DUF6325 family protein [Anaerolineales bacterium]|nr:DUF6325 family protein [Anaerolineales bacterium]